MFLKFIIPALSLVVASASASAAQTDQRTPAKPAAASAAKVDKICIKVAPMTGSRFEKIECKTRSEWARDGINTDELTS